MENRIVIIDGNSLLNRAYYAIQRPMITKEGLYTHGVYGFLNMLQKILTDYTPGHLAVTFDRKAPTFRHLEYAEYKAGRKKMPPELVMQLPLLKEVLGAMRVPILEIDGFEADDIIGTLAKKAEAAGLEPLIITGDRDELQLATDKTRVLVTKRGISEFEIYDADAMMEKYGFTPQQFVDYKGLMGDQSDNIPGIPGVGEKTAQKLILEFGSVAGLLANTESIANAKLRTKVEEYAQQALMSRRLAEINTEVPIEIDLEKCRQEEPDYDRLIEVYKRLEFNSMIRRLRLGSGGYGSGKPGSGSGQMQEIGAVLGEGSLSAAGAAATEALAVEITEKSLITSVDGLTQLQSVLKSEKNVIIKVFGDDNHRAIPQIFGISLLAGTHYYYLQPEGSGFYQELSRIFADCGVRFLGHQLQQDYYMLYANGFGSSAPETAFDTALAQYVLDPARSGYELKDLLLEHFHKELPELQAFMPEDGQLGFFESPQPDYAAYGALWCAGVAELANFLRFRVQEEALEPLLEQVEFPLIRVLAHMELAGFSVDPSELQRAGTSLAEGLTRLSQRIWELAGEEFNINSPKQLGQVLFEKMKLPAGKKNKSSGAYSTNAEVLEQLREDYEIAGLVLEYRTLAKLNGTYVEGLLPLIAQDGKIHAHFRQTVTATGRISCTEPNLQNIPIKQELGRQLRKAFIPESGDFLLVGADYSQIELRVLAHMSEDPSLIEAFNQGADIHRTTAARVFDVPEEQVTSLQRSNAKAVNFGVIYGMSGFGLSTELQISRKDAEKYIEEYFRKYTKVREFMERQVQECREKGYVCTIMGRKRTIPDIGTRNYMQRQAAERLAMNSPIQGSAADIIKVAMIRVWKRLQEEGLRSRLILQVHDELIIETYREELEPVKKLLVECMEQAVALKVRLVADLNTGENWYELK